MGRSDEVMALAILPLGSLTFLRYAQKSLAIGALKAPLGRGIVLCF